MNPQNSKQLSTKKVRKKIFLPRWEEKQSNGRRNLTPSTWAQSTRRNGSLSSPCVPRGCAPLSLSLFLFTTVLSLQCRTSCSSVHLSIIIIIMPHSQWGEAVWLVLRFVQWGKTISLNFKWLIFCTWEGKKKKKRRHFKSHYKIKNAC